MRSFQIKAGIVMGLLFAGSAVLAGVADDFKDAANRDGCEAIPYSSERSACNSAGREVDDWCKSSSRKWSCDDLDPSGMSRNIGGGPAGRTGVDRQDSRWALQHE